MLRAVQRDSLVNIGPTRLALHPVGFVGDATSLTGHLTRLDLLRATDTSTQLKSSRCRFEDAVHPSATSQSTVASTPLSVPRQV